MKLIISFYYATMITCLIYSIKFMINASTKDMRKHYLINTLIIIFLGIPLPKVFFMVVEWIENM